MTRGAAPAVAALLLVTACSAAPSPSSLTVASTSPGGSSPAPPSATASQTLAPTASPSASALADPGRPFDATDLLEAMSRSRRPGGIPERLQTRDVAHALAAEIWTIDGEPWDTMSVGGSCGPIRCTLDLGGARTGAAGEDLWTFEVIPDAGEVAVLSAELRSLPSELIEELDAVAREADARLEARDFLLVTARWIPPPGEWGFVLAYRSGDEEGACEIDLRVDAETAEVQESRVEGC